MMRNLITVGLLGSLMTCSSAWAAQGEVCRSTGGDGSPASPASNELTNALVFKCDAAGSKTISQLYADGWRVVQYMPMMGLRANADPRMPPTQGMIHVILIEKI